MAYVWAKQFYPWTLLYSDSVTPPGFPTRTAQGSCVLGNTPLSDITGSSSYPITWQILPDFKIVCTTSSNTKTFHFYFNNVESYSTNWSIDSSTRQFIGFIYDDSARKARCVMGRRYNAQGNYIYWGEYDSGGDSFWSQLYPYVKRALELQQPNWRSVKSLKIREEDVMYRYGKVFKGDGSTWQLSYIPDEYLNDGQEVTNGTHYVLKKPSISGMNDTLELLNNDYQSKTMIPMNASNNTYLVIEETMGMGSSFRLLFNNNTRLIQYSFTPGLGAGTPYLGFIVDDNNHQAKINIIWVNYSEDLSTGIITESVNYNTITHDATFMSNLYDWLNGNYGTEEDNTQQENPVQGGEETDPVIHTPLDPLSLPTKGAAGSGFIQLFKLDDSELGQLSDFLWDTNFITNVIRLFNDPREILVSLSVFPLNPKPETLTSDTIAAGNLSTGIVADRITEEYQTRFMGQAEVKVGNSDFMSFAPYRKIRIILPYCGEFELDPSAVYGRILRVYYHISFFTGACIAEIDRSSEVANVDFEPIYFFRGQIGYQIPISGEDFTTTVSALLNLGFTAIAGFAGGAGGGGGTGGGVSGALMKGGGKFFGQDFKPHITYSSGGAGSHGALNVQQVYMVIEESIPAYDGEQPEYIGNTFYKTMLLDDCEGYTKCFEAHIEGLSATENELKKIDDWLTSGVIIRKDGSDTPSGTPSVSGNYVINFMKTSSERNVIGKKWTESVAIEGKLLYEQSIEKPIIKIKGNMIGKNYCYIKTFGRFYFITDIKILENDLQEVYLESDPLQSFKTEILASSAAVDRQKAPGNKFIEDPYMWYQNNHKVSTVVFSPTDKIGVMNFDHQEDCYILAIVGKHTITPTS